MDNRVLQDEHEQALTHIDKADEWANKDNVDPDYRRVAVDYHLRLAQIHATLATAQKLDTLIGLVFDEGRPIYMRGKEVPH
jgi:hypothetical protein